MNKLQELKQIIADAPDGANEIEDTGRYWIYKGDGDYLLWDGREWIENWSPFHTRSLADIRTIVEQAEENEALKDRVAELEEENNKLKMPIELGERVIFKKEQFATHNIKQQVAAIRDAAEVFRILNGASTSDLLGYADKLEKGYD